MTSPRCHRKERGIQRTREMSMTMLPRAGMDCRTVDTMICRFFRNLLQRREGEREREI